MSANAFLVVRTRLNGSKDLNLYTGEHARSNAEALYACRSSDLAQTYSNDYIVKEIYELTPVAYAAVSMGDKHG